MNMIRNIKYALLIIGTGVATLTKTTHAPKQGPAVHVAVRNKQETSPTITIWVHGTKRLPGIAPLPFVKHFFDCRQGLHPAQSLNPKFHHRTIADSLTKADPYRFPSERVYLFGWSGELSIKEREQAAQNLYEEITKIREQYHAHHGVAPRLRIITHSHGGNVALNLAKIKGSEPFIIDELILLACPVQKKTAHLIQDPMFKKIYSLYSVLDMIQVADPQGLYHRESECPLFSQRCFATQANLTQREIRIKRRPIMHVEFMLGHFLKTLPELLDEWEKI